MKAMALSGEAAEGVGDYQFFRMQARRYRHDGTAKGG